MRVLFSALSPTYVKNFESVIRVLAARRHEVDLVLHQSDDTPAGRELVRLLASEPGVSVVGPPDLGSSARTLEQIAGTRASLDYLRFREPRFKGASLYRSRAKNVPTRTRRAAQLPLLRTPTGRRLLRGMILAADRRVRADEDLVRFLDRRRPDVVLLTPYIVRRDIVQAELARAARRLRLPTGVCVGSWDHLTTKASIYPQPDRVFVWNEVQLREAHELHGVPKARIVVTGAQCFDEWFKRRPTPREPFCSRVGIDADRPYVLYACSAPLKRRTPPEVGFALRWLEAVRTAGDPTLASAGVLLRPHPKRTEEWQNIDLGGHDNVAVFPREPVFPTSEEAKRDYFDSLYHCAAVVGMNTTAMLEAGVVGRPVFTTLDAELRASQTDLVHFGYLHEVGGGLVQVAQSLDEHLSLLAHALREPGLSSWDGRSFIREFLRPHGLDVDATEIFVDEVERLAARGAARAGHRLAVPRESPLRAG